MSEVEIRDQTEMMQYMVLFTLFGGRPAVWADYLISEGSETQRRFDLPLALRLAQAERQDRRLLDDLHTLIFLKAVHEH